MLSLPSNLHQNNSPQSTFNTSPVSVFVHNTVSVSNDWGWVRATSVRRVLASTRIRIHEFYTDPIHWRRRRCGRRKGWILYDYQIELDGVWGSWCDWCECRECIGCVTFIYSPPLSPSFFFLLFYIIQWNGAISQSSYHYHTLSHPFSKSHSTYPLPSSSPPSSIPPSPSNPCVSYHRTLSSWLMESLSSSTLSIFIDPSTFPFSAFLLHLLLL